MLRKIGAYRLVVPISRFQLRRNLERLNPAAELDAEEQRCNDVCGIHLVDDQIVDVDAFSPFFACPLPLPTTLNTGAALPVGEKWRLGPVVEKMHADESFGAFNVAAINGVSVRSTSTTGSALARDSVISVLKSAVEAAAATTSTHSNGGAPVVPSDDDNVVVAIEVEHFVKDPDSDDPGKPSVVIDALKRAGTPDAADVAAAPVAPSEPLQPLPKVAPAEAPKTASAVAVEREVPLPQHATRTFQDAAPATLLPASIVSQSATADAIVLVRTMRPQASGDKGATKWGLEVVLDAGNQCRLSRFRFDTRVDPALAEWVADKQPRILGCNGSHIKIGDAGLSFVLDQLSSQRDTVEFLFADPIPSTILPQDAAASTSASPATEEVNVVKRTLHTLTLRLCSRGRIITSSDASPVKVQWGLRFGEFSEEPSGRTILRLVDVNAAIDLRAIPELVKWISSSRPAVRTINNVVVTHDKADSEWSSILRDASRDTIKLEFGEPLPEAVIREANRSRSIPSVTPSAAPAQSLGDGERVVSRSAHPPAALAPAYTTPALDVPQATLLKLKRLTEAPQNTAWTNADVASVLGIAEWRGRVAAETSSPGEPVVRDLQKIREWWGGFSSGISSSTSPISWTERAKMPGEMITALRDWAAQFVAFHLGDVVVPPTRVAVRAPAESPAGGSTKQSSASTIPASAAHRVKHRDALAMGGSILPGTAIRHDAAMRSALADPSFADDPAATPAANGASIPYAHGKYLVIRRGSKAVRWPLLMQRDATNIIFKDDKSVPLAVSSGVAPGIVSLVNDLAPAIVAVNGAYVHEIRQAVAKMLVDSGAPSPPAPIVPDDAVASTAAQRHTLLSVYLSKIASTELRLVLDRPLEAKPHPVQQEIRDDGAGALQLSDTSTAPSPSPSATLRVTQLSAAQVDVDRVYSDSFARAIGEQRGAIEVERAFVIELERADFEHSGVAQYLWQIEIHPGTPGQLRSVAVAQAAPTSRRRRGGAPPVAYTSDAVPVEVRQLLDATPFAIATTLQLPPHHRRISADIPDEFLLRALRRSRRLARVNGSRRVIERLRRVTIKQQLAAARTALRAKSSVSCARDIAAVPCAAGGRLFVSAVNGCATEFNVETCEKLLTSAIDSSSTTLSLLALAFRRATVQRHSAMLRRRTAAKRVRSVAKRVKSTAATTATPRPDSTAPKQHEARGEEECSDPFAAEEESIAQVALEQLNKAVDEPVDLVPEGQHATAASPSASQQLQEPQSPPATTGVEVRIHGTQLHFKRPSLAVKFGLNITADLVLGGISSVAADRESASAELRTLHDKAVEGVIEIVAVDGVPVTDCTAIGPLIADKLEVVFTVREPLTGH